MGRLRRLSQPYFLPLEAGAGSFAQLLAALVAVVVGLSLVLLTAALACSSALFPDWQARFLQGGGPRSHGPLARTDRLDPAGFGGGWGGGLLELSGASCARDAGNPGCCWA